MKSLLLGNPSATSEQLQDHLSTLLTPETSFEQPHRLPSLAANSFDVITSCIPPFKTLDAQVLKGCLIALTPTGTLVITELMTTESQHSLDLTRLNIKIPSISKRKSELVMAGFTDITVQSEASKESDFSHLQYDDQGLQVLLKTVKVTITAKKPDFVVGASAKLSFKNPNSKKIWKISALDDDSNDLEIENDELLLGNNSFLMHR